MAFAFLVKNVYFRHVGRGGGQLLPQILADQKALPGSGGVPHYYLPSQIFRLCNMPVLRWVSKLGVLVCE